MAQKGPNEKDKPRRSQSPELGAGTGFTFEDAVSATFLSALLAEGYAAGVLNATVSRVALQQRSFNEPLDDIIVDFRDLGGATARLGLQVKRALTISAAKNNTDFREVIRDCWRTLHLAHFRRKVDRYGAAIDEVAKDKARDLISLCEAARESQTTEHFSARFAEGGNASKTLTAVKQDIVSLLSEVKGSEISEAETHEFLAHFVLLEFDFLHEGAVDPPDAMSRLRDCLAAGDVNQAPLLWTTLRQIARNSAGKAGEFDRPRLVRELTRLFRLRAAPSLRGDLEKITTLTRDWVADIQDDVGGTRLDRAALAAKLADALAGSRFVQIRGLPGSGKSVLLRQRVEADLAHGPVLFLKSDRLEGKGWTSFATTNGLSGAPLVSLLTEIAATGSDTLFIDGIDRIETDHQPIVLDILRTILRSPNLDSWKIVVSLRDTGIEPLRNWLGEVLATVSLTSLEVAKLADDEAEALAQGNPQLRALLFGPPQVREIVRRPFFAKILNQSFASECVEPRFEPQSEVDLLTNWWTRGGYNAVGHNAIERQRAIIELGAARARHLSRPVPLSGLTTSTIGLIEQLVVDGILQHVQKGHSVRFAHDIFFEWSFFHVLADHADKWLEEIHTCGEPPVVARVVELLSQQQYSEDVDWSATLHLIASSSMRSQWTRAWLLGPLASFAIERDEEKFSKAVLADECGFLRKTLVWFQAEKTTPNPNILAGDMPRDQRIRIADLLGWPSDFAAWRRLIEFLLKRVNSIPVALYPDILSVFEVWQNALAGMKNRVSRVIITQCADWLRDIDTTGSRKASDEQSRWSKLEEVGDFRKSLGRLIFRSAAPYPRFTEEYLKRIIASERLRGDRFKEVTDFSPILASTHPQLLVDLALRHLMEELPEDLVSRKREEQKHAAERRRKVLDKPEIGRTREDQLILQSGFSSHLGLPHFSYHDWDTLAIDRDSQNFWPPSPLREPFHSLFDKAPEEAIRLLNGICNHAVAAWRQLHWHHYESRGTPIPVEIQFPWGIQLFWGGDREYLWHRGTWAPNALACGFMALEEWCFAELERRRAVDELIRQIVQGNESIAILGVAAMLAMHANQVSETVFPIVAAQRLWSADRGRFTHDLPGVPASLIGFTNPSDKSHVDAIKAANARKVRQMQLPWLATLYVFNGEFKERIKAAILTFQDNLPYEIEEQRNDPALREHLKEQAIEWAEIVDTGNYQVAKPADADGRVEIVHVSPSASKPENVAKVERATLTLQEGNLWTWASKIFESGKVEDLSSVIQAVTLVRKLDDKSLFTSRNGEERLAMRRGAVAATAAVVLTFRENRTNADLKWARGVLARAIRASEAHEMWWSPFSVIPWHQGIFVARGLAAEVRLGTSGKSTAEDLLTLVAHPLEGVSLAALEQTATLWDTDPKLTWAALLLAFTLCHIEPQQRGVPRGPNQPIHSTKRVLNTLKDVIKFYRRGDQWPDLPLPPPAWIRVGNASPAARGADGAEFEFDEDDVVEPRESWAAPPTHWHSKYASKILNILPYEKILESKAKEELLAFVIGALQWTIAKNAPPWLKEGRRNRDSSQHYEWTREIGRTLARIAGMMPATEVRRLFLDAVFKLEGDTCWSLLSPFVSTYTYSHVYDAEVVPEGAIDILMSCLERVLKASSFNRNSHRSGEFFGFDLPYLVKVLMFVSVEHATLAARYANGDWSNLTLIFPIVDRFVRAAGWSATVMGHFLTLCERSKAVYPADTFADQILSVIGDSSLEPLKGWHGTFLPARIAGLVQYFASRDTPMPLALGQKLLRILDLLVDMGDRRSAALQLSESFREIKIM